ncbi:hypothetical protein ACH4E7_40155 [Kitasatospora sp. NPDC018058]|uniref:hypothetical protein n=1 Tax=Kitasatospora sp. NPDC018058 TaxID=3364025 RepID=UPI0037BF7F2E
MYEMHAEPVFDNPAPVLRWHAVRSGGTLVAVCGYRPLPLDPTLLGGREAVPEHYCAPCLDIVAQAMVCAGAA